MTIIYAVKDSGGEWEDSWDFISKAFFDKTLATDYMITENEELNKRRRIYDLFCKNNYEICEGIPSDYEGDYSVIEQANYYIEEIEVY